MQAILATRLNIDLQEPSAWVPQFCDALGQPQWMESLQAIVPFNDPEGKHIPASCCFRTIYTALEILRTQHHLPICLLHASEQLPCVNINDISVRFSRFEESIFVYFLLEMPEQPEDYAAWLRIADPLNEALDQRIKEHFDTDFHVRVKVEQYTEFLCLQSLTPLFSDKNAASTIPTEKFGHHCQGIGYERHTRLCYATEAAAKRTATQEGKGKFVRELQSIIVLQNPVEKDGQNEANERSHFYNMLHSEVVFFHRARCLEQKMQPTYETIDFLNDLLDKLQNQWVRIRSLFAITPKFSLVNRSQTSHLFFYILEVNAQATALRNKIQTELEKEQGPMLERYERLHFNAAAGTPDEQRHLQYVNEEVLKCHTAYSEKMNRLDRSVNRVSGSVQQLREDFDANTNIILQLLMFLLSVVVVVWGLVVLLVDKGMGVDPISSNLPTLMLISMTALVGILGVYGMVAKLYVNRSAYVLERRVHEAVKSCLRSNQECGEDERNMESRIATIVSDFVNGKIVKTPKWLARIAGFRANMDRRKIPAYQSLITQVFEISSLILPAVSLGKLKPPRARTYMEQVIDTVEKKLK